MGSIETKVSEILMQTDVNPLENSKSHHSNGSGFAPKIMTAEELAA
jgi:hypothetical protein